MLFDNVKIYVKAGNGGNGCVSFHREKYISHGGPDGGDGGKGGNVILHIDEGANTLTYYKYRRKFVAENGGDGMNSKFHGKNGADVILPVPPGTVVKEAETGLIIKDMSDSSDFLLCKGGKGGWGNRHFATPTRQIPRFAKSGIKGEEKEVILELKLIADVGLIGFPNVGKSSILSMISAAHPKVANYHFTTLEPNIGVVEVDKDQAFVAADIPGLIEGASDGAGLGHQFLRHVDRCRMLLHVVDVSGSEGRDPIDDIITINQELEKYSADLAKRPQIIIANKTDLLDKDADLSEFEDFVHFKGYDLIYVSAATGENIHTAVVKSYQKLQTLPPITVYESEYVAPNPYDEKSNHEITISKNDKGVYVVEGEWLYNLMGSINFDDRESLNYFERVLRQSKVIEKLENFGVVDGDTVSIYDFEFDFIQ
jgi:GTP-binding protein